MAKNEVKPTSTLYQRTEPPAQAQLPDMPAAAPTPPTAKPKGGRGIKSEDPRKMVGAGVKLSEKERLKAIAATHGVTLNSLIAFFIRDGVRRYESGELKIKVKTQSVSVVDMP